MAPPLRTAALAVSLALALAAGAFLLAAPVTGQPTVDRLDAVTAVQAGLVVSQAVFDDAATGHVVLVRDDVFADALVAGPLAGELPSLAPILFTAPDRLPDEVAAEVGRVTGGSGTVHVIGGSSAIGQSVVDRLTDDGHTVQRVGGQTRLETAQAVFDTYFAADLAGGDVMVARAFGSDAVEADAWPDAIAGGAFGAARGVPILLTPTAELSAGTANALQEAGAGAALVLGGTAAVAEQVVDALAEVVPEVVRIAGDTREETAVAIATELFGVPALTADDTVVLVNGRSSFAFGLAASTLAAAGDGPGEALLLLVTADSPTGGCDDPAEVGTPTACYLSAEGTEPGRIVVLGDSAQIAPAVEAAVAAARNGQ
jgi:putative cell wall-binding protein